MSDSATQPKPELQGLFDGLCYATGKAIGKIPLAGDVVDFGCSRVKARWRYMEVLPLLLVSIKERGRSDELTQFLLKEITATASFGARRRNFKIYYIDGKREAKLPNDPDEIMYGYW